MQPDTSTITSHHGEGNLRSVSSRRHRNQWLSQQIIGAVDRLNPGELRELLAIDGCTEALKKSDPAVARLCAALKRQVDAASETRSSTKLQAVWEVALLLLRALPGEKRLGFSAERLVFEMQKADPVGAASITLEAVQLGWSPTPRTNVFTLTAAQRVARSWEELKIVGDLSVALLDMGGLDLADPATRERLNVFLACTCDPRPAHERIGNSYPHEVSISDVAWRIQLGAQVADAAVRAGVNFSTNTTAKRIDMSIRGIASVGTALGLECGLRDGSLTRQAIQEQSRRLELGRAWAGPDWKQEDLGTLRAVSEWLLLAAVNIAQSCFMEVDDGHQGVRPDLCYALTGQTLSNLILGLCAANVPCDDTRCPAVAELLWRSLRVSHVAKDVSNRAIQGALNWMDCEALDPAVRGDAILAVLHHTITTINDIELLERMGTRICEYTKAVPEMYDRCSWYLDAMSVRRDELMDHKGTDRLPDSEPPSGSVAGRPRNPEATWFSDMVTEASGRNRN